MYFWQSSDTVVFCFLAMMVMKSRRSDDPVKVMRSVFFPSTIPVRGRSKSSLSCLVIISPCVKCQLCVKCLRIPRGDHGFYSLKHGHGASRLSISAETVAQAAQVDRLANIFGKMPGKLRPGHAAVVFQHFAHLCTKGVDLLWRRFRRPHKFRLPRFSRNGGELKKAFHRLADEEGDGLGNAYVAALAVDGAVHSGKIAAQDGGDRPLVDALGGEFVFYGLR